jgi:hypothetical protein
MSSGPVYNQLQLRFARREKAAACVLETLSLTASAASRAMCHGESKSAATGRRRSGRTSPASPMHSPARITAGCRKESCAAPPRACRVSLLQQRNVAATRGRLAALR